MLGSLLAVAHFAAQAANTRTPVSLLDYQRTTWTQKDGAPAGIQAMARSSDGWLWLGTSAGVFQFDGLSFSPRDSLPAGNLHSRSVRRLLTTSNGDLWVFFSAGGASVLRRGDRDHPAWIAGLSEGATIDSEADDDQNHVWITSGPHIYRNHGDQWEQVRPSDVGLPEDGEPTVFSDHRGNVWYCTDTRIYVRTRFSNRFVPINGNWHAIQTFVFSAAGGMSVVDGSMSPTDASTQLSVPAGSRSARSSASSEMSMRDVQGAIWSVECDHADLCFSPRDSTTLRRGADEQSDPWKADGEKSPGTMTLLVDEEGNTWVGTKLGLVQFRLAAARRVRFPDNTYFFTVVPDADGTVVVGTDGRSDNAVDQLWRVDTDNAIHSLSSHATSAAWLEPDHSILLAGPLGIWRFDGRSEVPLEGPHAVSVKGVTPQSMAEDGAGRLWLAFNTLPPWRKDTLGWRERGGIAELPAGLVALIVPSGNDTWLGYRSNMLVRLDAGDHVSQWDQRQGLVTGSVTALITKKPMLVGGERGLQWFDGKAFHAIHAADVAQLSGITGLLRDQDGSLWINGFRGLVHYPADEVAHALSDENFAMHGRLYDEGDGVPGTAQQARPLPTLTRGSDGRIWVASTNGMSSIDPPSLPVNRQSPSVEIAGVNDVAQPANGLDLPAGTRQLRMRFHVLSLTRPDRTQVRYRLLGLDDKWIDAGTRREAFFGNLGPGRYRFELIAGNEDGVWTSQATGLPFNIEPTFFQTGWFKSICVIIGLVALWLIFRWRLRHERKLMRQKMAVRHAERERIARELHDTLLQGISGLLMRVQVWSGRRELPTDLQGDMQRASEQGRSMLSQGRDRIAELRADDGELVNLSNAIRVIGDKFAALHAAGFVVIDHAPDAALRHDVSEDVLAIVHEAIANAYAHAGGKSVKVKLEERAGRIGISVTDDGCGISSEQLDEAGTTGHWGLVGMRERARRIGVRLVIGAGETGGTRVLIEGIRPVKSSVQQDISRRR